MTYTPLSRRQLLAFATLAAVPILAACGGTAPATPTTAASTSAAPTAAPSTAPAAAPTTAPAAAAAPTPAATTAAASAAPAGSRGKGGTLKLLWWQAPTILNSHLSQGTKDFDASRVVLEPLAGFGPDGTPVPALAAEIPTVANGGVSQDLKTVTWKLKSGVKWSDGSPFTADDVVFTYQYMSDPKTAATTADAAKGIESVVAKDPQTVVVTWKNPNPNFYQIYVGYESHIIQKSQFQNYMGAQAKNAPGNLKPIGTGAYMVQDFKPGDVVTYVPNPNFRDPNKPYFSQVELKGGGDATSAARAVFQTGDVDYAWNLQVESTVLNQLIKGGKGVLVSAVGPNVERLLLNRADPNKTVNGARAEPSTKHPFLSDLKVRQALAMATDRKTIADQLYGAGLSGAMTTNIITAPPPLVSPNTAKLDIMQFDLAKANQLLDGAGWTKGSDGVRQKNGVKMHVVYQTTINDVRQKTQDIIKQAWEQIGVQVELKTINANVFFSSDPGNPDTSAHFYTDVEMFTNGQNQPDATTYLAGWTTDQIAQKSNEWRGNNYERWSNAQYDQLYRQLLKETDQDKRAQLVIKMNDLMMQDVVDIPLVARKGPVSGRSSKLQGIIATPWDSELWNVGDWSKSG